MQPLKWSRPDPLWWIFLFSSLHFFLRKSMQFKWRDIGAAWNRIPSSQQNCKNECEHKLREKKRTNTAQNRRIAFQIGQRCECWCVTNSNNKRNSAIAKSHSQQMMNRLSFAKMRKHCNRNELRILFHNFSLFYILLNSTIPFRVQIILLKACLAHALARIFHTFAIGSIALQPIHFSEIIVIFHFVVRQLSESERRSLKGNLTHSIPKR